MPLAAYVIRSLTRLLRSDPATRARRLRRGCVFAAITILAPLRPRLATEAGRLVDLNQGPLSNEHVAEDTLSHLTAHGGSQVWA